MLLRDFKTVSELDGTIDTLHSQLKDLYEKRAQYTQTKPVAVELIDAAASEIVSNTESWVQYEYTRLAQAWARYDIKFPAMAELSSRIEKSRQLIIDLGRSDESLRDAMTVVAVPPASILNSNSLSDFRSKQGITSMADYIDPAANRQQRTKKWRLLAVYSNLKGIDMGSAEQILTDKSYMSAGHDMRALGVHEYIAFSLQHHSPIDVDSWSLLLKGYSRGDVPSVALTGGHFRFALDDPKGLGNERFRPAMEIV